MRDRMYLSDFAGEWSGTNRLWLSPHDPVRECDTAASVSLAARGALAVITYTWSDLGAPQEGILLVRAAPEPGSLDMVWFDSWHTGGEFMLFRGEEDLEGRISALGSYGAPPGPDWGWRIVLAATPDGGMQLFMYNIAPAGQEMLAVEASYTRAAPARSGA